MQMDVAIFGSCVSRDTLAIAMPDVTCLTYVARQSVISVGNPAPFDPARFTASNNFTRKAFDSDVEGSGLVRLAETAAATDVLLWDIVDERLGVYIHKDGGVLTRSADAAYQDTYGEMDDWTAVHFGTERHLAMFGLSAMSFVEELENLDLKDKTLFVAAPWATLMTSGQDTPRSYGHSADEANVKLIDYVNIIRELGVTIIEPDQGTVVGDPDHQWGPAAFHYIEPFYESLAAKIIAFVESR